MSQRSLSDFGVSGARSLTDEEPEQDCWHRVVPVDYKNHYACPLCLAPPRYFTTEGTEHHPDESRCGYCGGWLPIHGGQPGDWSKLVSVKEAAGMVMKMDIRISKTIAGINRGIEDVNAGRTGGIEDIERVLKF